MSAATIRGSVCIAGVGETDYFKRGQAPDAVGRCLATRSGDPRRTLAVVAQGDGQIGHTQFHGLALPHAANGKNPALSWH